MPGTPQPFDERNYRDALGTYPTGGTVVATSDARGRAIGLTVNSFASVSLDPPLILWSLARSSENLAGFLEATHFSVNVLAADQREVSERFAQAGSDRFAGLRFSRGLAQVPLIPRCLAQLECATEARPTAATTSFLSAGCCASPGAKASPSSITAGATA